MPNRFFLPGVAFCKHSPHKLHSLHSVVLACLLLVFCPVVVRADNCIDYASPPPIAWIGQANTPEIAEDVATAGRYAFTTGNGLHVIDILNPSNPQSVGSIFTHSAPRALAVAWPYVYIAGADFETSLDVIDVTAPNSPNIVGTVWGIGYYPVCAAIYGSHVILGIFSNAFGNHIAVVDVSNPALPGRAGGIELGYPGDIAVLGTHAYVPNGGAGLTIMDLTSLPALSIVDNIPTVGFARGISIAGNMIYVCANGAMDLQIFDGTNPTAPTFLGGIDIPNGAIDVAVSAGFAYVTGSSSGLSVVDVRVPAAPVLVGGAATQSPNQPTGIVSAGSNILVSDPFGGLLIYPPQCPTTTGIPNANTPSALKAMLYPNSPNPFSDQTTIRFNLTDAVPASIRIYDSAGRLVRNLNLGIRGGGESQVIWNGRGEAGERLSSGVYFYRLEAPGIQETRPLVLMD